MTDIKRPTCQSCPYWHDRKEELAQRDLHETWNCAAVWNVGVNKAAMLARFNVIDKDSFLAAVRDGMNLGPTAHKAVWEFLCDTSACPWWTDRVCRFGACRRDPVEVPKSGESWCGCHPEFAEYQDALRLAAREASA